MDTSTLSFLALVVLIGVNRFLHGLLRKGSVPWAFWPVQILNGAAMVSLVGWGLPGFDAELRVVPWFVAGLVLLHLVENLHLRQVIRGRSSRQALLREEERLHRELADRLARPDDAQAPPPRPGPESPEPPP